MGLSVGLTRLGILVGAIGWGLAASGGAWGGQGLDDGRKFLPWDWGFGVTWGIIKMGFGVIVIDG